MDNLSPKQREAFQTHLNDLYDDYLDQIADLINEAKVMVPNSTYDEGDQLDNVRSSLAGYAKQANLIAQDYYRNVRAAWALAADVDLPDFTPAQVTSDRAAWQVFGGYNDSDFAGLKFTDVINGRARSGVTMRDLWAKKTAGYDDDQWAQLAKDIINSTTRLTQRFTAEKDPSKPRYARVPQGATCEFCIMLASRGFVYWSEESAGKFNGYHRDDNCQIVSSWGRMQVKGYDPDGMKDRYKTCSESIAKLLTEEKYDRYVTSAKEHDEEIYKFDEWKTRQILAEMRQRDYQWLYDGTVPKATYESNKAKTELKPHENRTLDVLAKNGFAAYVLERSDKQGVKTADLMLNGHEVDLKSPIKDTYNAIDGEIRKAGQQGYACVMHLQDGRSTIKTGTCREYIIRSLSHRKKLKYVLLIDYQGGIERIMNE